MIRIAWKPGSVTSAGGAVHVSATRFTYRSLGAMPGVFWHGARLRRRWHEIDGAIGVFLAADFFARTTYTVSVWQSERHLTRWLSSPNHARLMRAYRSRMEGSAAVGWGEERFALAGLFREGMQRLAAKERSRGPT